MSPVILLTVALLLLVGAIVGQILADGPAREPEPAGPLDAAFQCAPALRRLPGWQPDAAADPCDVVRAAYETNVIEKVYRGLSQPEGGGPAIRVLATWWLERGKRIDSPVDWFGQPSGLGALVDSVENHPWREAVPA